MRKVNKSLITPSFKIFTNWTIIFLFSIVFVFSFYKTIETLSIRIFGQETKALVIANIDTDTEKYMTISYKINNEIYTANIENAKNEYDKDDTLTIYVDKNNNEKFIIFPKYLALFSIFTGLSIIVLFFPIKYLKSFYKKIKHINKLLNEGVKRKAIVTEVFILEEKEETNTIPFIVYTHLDNDDTIYKSIPVYSDFKDPNNLINRYVNIYFDNIKNYYIDVEGLLKDEVQEDIY